MASKPGVPDALTARAVSATSIEVTWQATSTNHTHFDLEARAGASLTWARVATPPAAARSFTHAGLKATTRYTYRLRAVNAAGSSPWSAATAATTGTVTPPSGQAFYVAPTGSPTAAGTLAAPWDLASALTRTLPPGATLHLRGGTYRSPRTAYPDRGFPVTLAGTGAAPIIVRPYPGERARIDGGLWCQPGFTNTHLRDLEVFVSEPRPTTPADPPHLGRPHGGVHVFAGSGVKLINLVIHDCGEGIGLWTEARDAEVHGCLIYDNGWIGTDRPHGHGIYTQNDQGTKVISDCILTGNYGYGMHAYGEQGLVNNYLVEGTISYDSPETRENFLVGGLQPSKNIRVLANHCYQGHLDVGYQWAPYNENCEVRDNIVTDGYLTLNKWRSVQRSGNRNYRWAETVTDPANEIYLRPTTGVEVFTRPNRYDANRAHVVVYNWEKRATVTISPPLLRAGDTFRLLDPRHFFGTPVLAGTYNGSAITVPMSGEFAAFVVLRG